MVGADRVIMSVKELRRVHVIRLTMAKKRTQVQAGTVLGLTTRPIRRLIERVEPAGDQGRAHRGRGKPANRRIPDQVKARMRTRYEKREGDFGPTVAVEKLTERQGLTLSDETLRRWLRARGVVHCTRRKRPHRAWRERRAHVGERIPRDGSPHDWLEEGTLPALDSFQRSVTR